MRRSLSGLCRFCGRLVLAAGLCLLVGSLVEGPYSPLSASQKKSKSKKKGKNKGTAGARGWRPSRRWSRPK